MKTKDAVMMFLLVVLTVLAYTNLNSYIVLFLLVLILTVRICFANSAYVKLEAELVKVKSEIAIGPLECCFWNIYTNGVGGSYKTIGEARTACYYGPTFLYTLKISVNDINRSSPIAASIMFIKG